MKGRILVVDDNDDCRVMLVAFLQQDGYEVDSVGRGQHGLHYYHRALHNKRPYNIIILDLALPDIDGFSICQNIRNLEKFKDVIPRATIIFITAYDETVQPSRLKVESCHDSYLSKPVDPDNLLKTIETLFK